MSTQQQTTAHNNNVIGFNPNSVYSDIQTFLNDEAFSSRTKVEYLHDIKLFFTYNNKLNIETLSPNDLHFENSSVLRYRNYLIQDKKMSPNTVNRKLASLQSLYTFFKKNKYDTKHNIDCDVFQIKKLKTVVKSYGQVAPEELEAMFALVTNQVKGYEKKMYLYLATRTSIREDALLSVTWDDITYNKDNDCYIVYAIDKNGTERNQPISKQLYNDLIQIKELTYYQRYSDNKIFHLTPNTLSSMMKTLCEEIGIHPSRKVVIHSLRSFAANYIIDTTNDLRAAADMLGHKSIETSWKHYISKNKDISQSAGLMLDQKISDDILDDLTQDELLNLIKSKPDIFNKLKAEYYNKK